MKRILAVLLVTTVLISLCSCVCVKKPDDLLDIQDAVDDLSGMDSNPENFEYTIDSYVNHTAKITKYTGTSTKVKIPETIDNYTVIGYIGMDIFPDNVEKIVFPNNVTDIFGEAISNTAFYRDEKNWENNALYIEDILVEVRNIESYEVKDGTKHISIDAFSGNDNLMQVKLPESIVTVGHSAFKDCSALTSVHLGNQVQVIDSEAFMGCSALTSVNIPESVREIGANVFTDTPFYNARMSSAVYIDNCLIDVDSDYKGSFVIAEGTRVIAKDAMRSCGWLTSVHIPDSVKYIGDLAFYDCEDLETVRMSENLISLGAYAFARCDRLEYVKLPKTLSSWADTTVGDGYVYTRKDGYTQYDIDEDNPAFYSAPDGGIYSKDKKTLYFYAKTNQKYITVPEGVETICGQAFSDCFDMQTAYLPDSLQRIENQAFAGCTQMLAIHIPKNVNYLGVNLFSGCRNLDSITVDPENRCFTGADNILYDKNMTTLLETANAGMAHIAIPEGVIRIQEGAFYQSDIRTVSCSSSLEYIGNSAFSHCEVLENIQFSNGLKHIGEDAFWGCESLVNVQLPNSLEYIGDAFSFCDGLVNVQFPDSLKHIGDGAFLNCSSLANVQFPDSLEHIGFNAFSDCDSLVNVQFPDSLEHIGNRAFSECDSLVNVQLSDSLEHIGDYAFSDCDSLVNVQLSNSLKHIGDYAFAGCDSLGEVQIPDSVEYVGRNVFGKLWYQQ